MSGDDLLETKRLLLRRWREEDRDAFAALNADAAVMEQFPATLTRARSDLMFDVIEAGFDVDGFGLWAVETIRAGTWIGFVGLSAVSFLAPFTPAVEVGWRLLPAAWGHGYATEAATAALAFGFETIGLKEVVSFTSATNLRSVAVMERLGMVHDRSEDFDHPRLASDHPLARHVLYRISAERWRQAAAAAASGAALSPESGRRP